MREDGSPCVAADGPPASKEKKGPVMRPRVRGATTLIHSLTGTGTRSMSVTTREVAGETLLMNRPFGRTLPSHFLGRKDAMESETRRAGSSALSLGCAPTSEGETMNKQRLIRGFAISTVGLLGLLLSNSILSDDQGNGGGRRAHEAGLMGPAPKAVCGRSDHTESGLQGQTTSQ